MGVGATGAAWPSASWSIRGLPGTQANGRLRADSQCGMKPPVLTECKEWPSRRGSWSVRVFRTKVLQVRGQISQRIGWKMPAAVRGGRRHTGAGETTGERLVGTSRQRVSRWLEMEGLVRGWRCQEGWWKVSSGHSLYVSLPPSHVSSLFPDLSSFFCPYAKPDFPAHNAYFHFSSLGK